jgi:hypothetical protein
MARAVVGNPFENQIPTVSPTAQPVDIYQRGVVKSSPFASLAENLSRLSQKADRAFGNVEKRAAEREFAEGQELYNKTRLAIGDAVREGIIDEGESPYLRKGYRVSQLNVLANKYATDLNVALEAQQLYKNGNPAAAEKFSQNFYDKFVEANDLSAFAPTELAEFLTPTTQKANAAFISSWKTKNISWQREQNYIQLGQEIGAYTDSFNFYTGKDPKAFADNRKALSDWIQSKVDGAEVNGMDRQKVNKLLVDSLILTAEENKDADLLNILDDIQVGTGKLGSSIAVRNAVLSSQKRIASALQSEEVAQARADKAEADAKQDGYESAALIAGLKLLSGDNSGEAMQELEASLADMIGAGNASDAKTWLNFALSMEKQGSEVADNAASAKIFEEIFKDDITQLEAAKILTTAITNGEITKESARSFLSDITRRLEKEGKITPLPILKSGNLASETYDDFVRLVGAKDKYGNFIDQNLINRAKRDFQALYVDWYNSQEVPPSEAVNYQKALEISEALTNKYVNKKVENRTDETLEAIEISRDPEKAAAAEAELAAQLAERERLKKKNDAGLRERLLNWWNSESNTTAPLPKKIN